MHPTGIARPLRLGLVVNPCAGLGGEAGFKGSDDPAIRAQALAAGVRPRAGERAQRFLLALAGAMPVGSVELLAWGGAMGADPAAAAGWQATVAGPAPLRSAASDTAQAARALAAAGIDLLLFVGGDGTARDVCDAVGLRVPVLGIPAGVKMYSAVFAVAPEAAAAIVARLARGEPVPLVEAEVRDIDEHAFRADRVASRRYGALNVPGLAALVQQVKCSSTDNEQLQQEEIAAFMREQLQPGVLYLVGPGSTTRALMAALGLPGTLLGFDAVRDGQLVAADLDAAAMRSLLDRADGGVEAVLTATGGQGFLLGRGNQQLAADLVRRIGRARLHVLATPLKLARLAGRPLLVDTGDLALDRALAGLWPVLTGYEQQVLYRVAAAADGAVPADD